MFPGLLSHLQGLSTHHRGAGVAQMQPVSEFAAAAAGSRRGRRTAALLLALLVAAAWVPGAQAKVKEDEQLNLEYPADRNAKGEPAGTPTKEEVKGRTVYYEVPQVRACCSCRCLKMGGLRGALGSVLAAAWPLSCSRHCLPPFETSCSRALCL